MKKSLHVLLALLVAATLVFSLVSCMPEAKPKNEEEAAPTEDKAPQADDSKPVEETDAPADGEINTTDPITLRMNWWGGDARHEATLAAIQAFMDKYPNITVEAEYESFSGHEEKVALALNAGSAADVIQLNMDWVFNYSPNGDVFYDLNDVSEIIDLSAYDEVDKEFYTINGSLQALPIANTGRGFFWNKTTFDAIGVDIPKTLDDLLAAGDAFAAYEDGSYYPMACADYVKMDLMVYYLQSTYGKPWIKDFEMQYTEEEIIEGMNFILELEDRHVIPDSEKLAGEGTDLIETNPNWISGKYAGAMVWDTNIDKYKDASPESEFVVGDFLDMGDYHGGQIKASQVIAITETSEHPNEAAALVQFLFGDEEGVTILQDTRGVPSNKHALEYLDFGDSPVAEMNRKLLAWTDFKLDTVSERSALKAADGVYSLVFQSLSYKQETPEVCAEMLINGINTEIESARP